MKHAASVMCCLLACLMLSGCHAARPLAARQLLMWTGPSCSGVGGIGIGNAQALFMPGHNLVMGQVQLRNSGPRPFGFQSGGVKLAGPAGPLDCNLRCPQAVVPAGGSLQCGFVAQAPRPYTTFRPFLVPQAANGQCFAAQPFAVRPKVAPIAPATAGANSNAFTNAGVAQAFADACAQAFGASFSDALSKATSWNGDAYSLANAVASSVFGPAVANSQSNAQAFNGVASAQGNAVAQTAFGPALANSASNALQAGWNGVALAADKALAASGNGPAAASSQANAVNAGRGPAIASSSATAVSNGK